jgi:hypothetical protein
MPRSFICFNCEKAMPLLADNKCPSCGSLNGEVISNERLKEDVESGAFFKIDPKTGMRAKKKKH